MSEKTKRFILCAAIGWFSGGHNVWEWSMAVVGVIIFVTRVYLFDDNGVVKGR